MTAAQSIPKEQWEAERVVDEVLAATLIGEQFGDLAGTSVTPFGLGWDNTAFLVAEQWVFRFPRRLIAAKLIEREARLLPAIAPRLPLAIPIPAHVAKPTERYPWPFSGYRVIAGTTACGVRFNDQERASCANTLGAFLRALHGLSAQEAIALGAPGDELARLDVPTKTARALATIEELRAHDLLDGATARRIERNLADTPLPAALRSDTLVHGDLYARHLLVDDARTLVAVIDWGDIHVGDPAVDLSVAHAFLPVRAHDAFRMAYGTIDEAMWLLARFRAVYHSLFVVRYAQRVGDQDLLTEALSSLARIAGDARGSSHS